MEGLSPIGSGAEEGLDEEDVNGAAVAVAGGWSKALSKKTAAQCKFGNRRAHRNRRHIAAP